MAKKLATRVTRARGMTTAGQNRGIGRGATRLGARAKTRQPVQKAQSARAGIRSKGAARLGAGSG